jgi:ketosteroid isomerase-like protein
MSQENVEFVHRAIDAFNRQDLAALAEFCTDDFEFVSMLTAVDAGGSTYRGRHAWSEYFARMRDTWAEWWVDDFQVFDAGNDSLAAVVQMAGRGQHSGVAVDRTIGMTYRLRDGVICHMRAYLEPREALEAVGLEAGDG